MILTENNVQLSNRFSKQSKPSAPTIKPGQYELLSSLDFSKPALRALRSEGITMVNHLLEKGPGGLKTIPGIGPKYFNECVVLVFKPWGMSVDLTTDPISTRRGHVVVEKSPDGGAYISFQRLTRRIYFSKQDLSDILEALK